ncbi:MAG TPA: DUF192 domain-containing protein [Actinomycetota bacterium]|nr:DUF192 domain-containing protein [Actinomycetota bacterium]
MSTRRARSSQVVLLGPHGVACERLEVARGAVASARGLLGRSSLGPDEGLLLKARRVHTFGMRFPIDAVFCGRDLRVVGVETLEPNRLSRRYRGARRCVELAAGAASRAGIVPGVTLRTGQR